MKIAIEEALYGVKNNHGGPFGAVIIKDKEIIAKAHNMVLLKNDPTAHAEMEAIREASQKLGRFDLSDCELYTSCEPCPMCLSAIYWAKIKKVYYACTKADAAEAGFDDEYIYEVLTGKNVIKKLEMVNISREDAIKTMLAWEEKDEKIQY